MDLGEVQRELQVEPVEWPAPLAVPAPAAEPVAEPVEVEPVER